MRECEVGLLRARAKGTQHEKNSVREEGEQQFILQCLGIKGKVNSSGTC